MFRLETERLVLREWTDDDLDALAALSGDPQVMRYITGGKTRTREQSAKGLARQQDHQSRLGYAFWAAEEKASGRVIGLNGIQPLLETGDVEIGWWLEVAAWGKGLATEGARRSAAFAFEEAGLERLVAIAAPENTASIRIMDKLGMTFARATTFGALGTTLPELADFALHQYVLERADWEAARGAARGAHRAGGRGGGP